MILASNESLPAIVAGLDPQPTDRVLAVGCSGDQGFALLEFVEQVDFVDRYEPHCINIKKRAQALKKNDRKGFLPPYSHPTAKEIKCADKRDKYFSPQRFSEITGQTKKITVTQGDIFEQRGLWNKIYLTNLFPFDTLKDFENLPLEIAQLSRQLAPGGLLYHTKHQVLFEGYRLIRNSDFGEGEDFTGNDQQYLSEMLGDLQLDQDLTKKARELETSTFSHINPAVYYKPKI